MMVVTDGMRYEVDPNSELYDFISQSIERGRLTSVGEDDDRQLKRKVRRVLEKALDDLDDDAPNVMVDLSTRKISFGAVPTPRFGASQKASNIGGAA
jgi:hypothetical protein